MPISPFAGELAFVFVFLFLHSLLRVKPLKTKNNRIRINNQQQVIRNLELSVQVNNCETFVVITLIVK